MSRCLLHHADSDIDERLALFTRSGKGEHTMYLYDVSKNNFRAATTLKLEDFPHRTDISSEVTCAKFSPDGLFLAVARNDNFTHIYDARMLDEPIHRLGHAEYEANDSILGTNYGVTHLEWVEEHRGGGLGLVTGGGDGCVYLWDMLRAHSADPDLLAETDHGVATFSLGDRGNGEKRLVVCVSSPRSPRTTLTAIIHSGDCGGQVRFFN
ncbi:hypothetical protein PENSPDRAFT_590124 [Peniophora sp. CONT]|nr:hypothetical protein PENSPDRAFT_590124 [Peniophora sp. CONT]